MLLSFAQFEREVTSERIRDKIAASKRKGMWMGGPVPLGYRLEGRKLVLEPSDADIVRHIFGRYSALRSTNDLVDELVANGIRSKKRVQKTGRSLGGVPFSRGALTHLLKNPLYVGKVAHAGELYDGEHEPIIEEVLWDAVQATLRANTHDRRLGKNAQSPSLLAGMLYDPDDRPMTPTFTTKGSRQHRYYVTRLKAGEDRKSVWRVPAGEIDRAVLACVSEA